MLGIEGLTLPAIGAVLLATVAIYLYLVLILRLTGNRTLSGLRAFDFVVTVAIGSIVATSATPGSGSTLVKGMVAVTALVLLQVGVAWMAGRSQKVNNLVTSPPRLLLYEGRCLEEQLRKAHITRAQLMQQIRSEGFAKEEDVWAAVLETSGTISVVPMEAKPEDPQVVETSLEPVPNAPPR